MKTDDHSFDRALGELRDVPLVDRVEERNAHADVQAALFDRRPRPVALGRYVVLHRIGAGGSGTIYRAYDSDLHRQVAIKIVAHADTPDSAEPDRLMREARVLASLSHPNIVAIFDVGIVPRSAVRALGGGGIYVVMELVEGNDLRQWCRLCPRSWPEILPVLTDAARGLSAAHEAGIVHLDVKPHNVRVGDDGRARVLDFGIASAFVPRRDDARSDEQAEDLPLRIGEMAAAFTTARSGTPPYMAPEQHAAEVTDERTDQFGFCVMAWEVLFGQRPFGGDSVAALAQAKRSGPPAVPDGRVPGWLGTALRRGLDPEPGRRFSSMGELIATLDRARARRHRRWGLLAGLGASTLVAAALYGGSSPDPLCDDVAARLDGVWDSALRIRTRDAFTTAAVPYGEDAWSTANEALDAWASRWTEEYQAVCATPETPELVARRTLCLGRQLDQVGRTAHLLASADETVVQHTQAVVEELPDPIVCRTATGSHEPDLDTDDVDPARRAALAAVDAEMQRAALLRSAGKVREAASVAEEVEAEAVRLDARRTLARARLLRCRVGLLDENIVEQQQVCDAALQAAELSGSDRLAISALLRLAEVAGQTDSRERADAWFRAAWARLQAAPPAVASPGLTSWYLSARGKHEQARGNLAGALDLLEQSLEVLGPEARGSRTARLPPLVALATLTASLGRMGEAHAHHREALHIAVSAYGELHPRTGMVTNNYGNFLLVIGRYEDSARMLERALHIKRTVLGDDSPLLATTHLVLARVHNRMGRWDTALEHAERSVELHERMYPDGDERRALAVAVRARALHGLGRCNEVIDELAHLERRSSALTDRPRFDPSDISLVLGSCLDASGQPEAARTAYERALAAQEAFWGPDDRHLVEALVALATPAHLARARRIVDSTEGNPEHATLVAEATARLAHR